MQLSQTTWLKCNESCGQGLAGGEVCRVDLVKRASLTGDRLRLVLEGPVDERGVAGERASGSGSHVLSADGAVEDVRVRLRNVVKDGSIHAKILGQNVSRRVCNPVINIEGGSTTPSAFYTEMRTRKVFLPNLVKVRIIEDKEVLILILESLNGMRDTLGEVPDVAVVECLYLVPPQLVDGRDEDGTRVDEPPFRLRSRVRTPRCCLLTNLLHGANGAHGRRPSSGAAGPRRCHGSGVDPG